jgi:16S rRNA A1518/A1519 N6-dimethyltransferase RsmA/KsgA/DIM1 with predicted DNA glycosylase/AP lyase activity
LQQTEQVTRAAFTQRRKKLRNSIRAFLEGKDEDACPIDLERRADALSPREFVLLAEFLFPPG